jgi:hypothetical protein
MNEIAAFYTLKIKVLETYRESYPFFRGSIHEFGNKEIAQLQELIENKQNERVSEKWVYTHLKPKANEKIPRKDMLDILCKFAGYTNWDEFLYKHSEIEKMAVANNNETQNNTKYYVMGGIFITVIGLFLGINQYTKTDIKTICFKDKYTQKTIDKSKITVFEINQKKKQKLSFKNDCLEIEDRKEMTLVIESPYYKSDTLIIKDNSENINIDLQPDDYAMMMRAYMNSDLEDWNKRKLQLESIISDNAEIEEVMFEEIGVEFLDKKEFIDKIVTPSETVRKMEIIAIKYENDKIISLKFIQK